MNKQTYKQQWIEKVTKMILKQDRIYTTYSLDLEARKKALYNANNLRNIRDDIRQLETRHFVPSRFPSAEFLSIQLSLSNEIYN